MNDKTLYKILLDRNAKYDGRIFFGVRTTGIYCRPICPARKPKAYNVVYFKNAVEAQESGYRACKRCRPESLPGTSAWIGKTAVLKRVQRLIEGGVYDREGITGLTKRIGIGDRQLRRLFKEEYKLSPREKALDTRLQLSRKLAIDTFESFTEIALASGFKSVRRFNDAFKKKFGITPTQTRKAKINAAL